MTEGDHKAFYETTQAQLKANTDRINQLRSDNKTMATKLKTLKGPSGQTAGGDGKLQLLDQRACDMIKRHNTLRAQVINE